MDASTLQSAQESARLLESIADARQVLLKTRKRDGTWVGTPVNLGVEGDHAYFRTWSTSGKAKRLRHTPDVQFAPCTASGRVTGPWMTGRSTLVISDAARAARRLIEHKHPLLQRVGVRLWHRLRGLTTQHYVLEDVRAAVVTPTVPLRRTA